MQPLYVSLATPMYEPEAARLESSLRRLGLPYHIERPAAEAADWTAGVHLRVPLLRRLRGELPDRPLVWIDADAVVWVGPSWPDASEADFAAHWFRDRELLGGTTWWAPTPAATALLDAWLAENRRRPKIRDQVNLAAVLPTVPDVRTVRLPPELCFIFDLSRRVYPDAQPIIEHFQASRRHRGGRGGRR